jgi:cytochrome c-type biogenesis protein CcmH
MIIASPEAGRWRGLLASLVIAIACLGASAGTAFADTLDDETRRIAKQLQCPICESVSVADSTAELATQMRAVIRKKLENGESEAEIIAYFVERYGEGVRTEPTRSGFAGLVWTAPVIALLAGFGALVALLRAWLPTQLRRNGVDSPGVSRPTPEQLDRARREWEHYRSAD